MILNWDCNSELILRTKDECANFPPIRPISRADRGALKNCNLQYNSLFGGWRRRSREIMSDRTILGFWAGMQGSSMYTYVGVFFSLLSYSDRMSVEAKLPLPLGIFDRQMDQPTDKTTDRRTDQVIAYVWGKFHFQLYCNCVSNLRTVE